MKILASFFLTIFFFSVSYADKYGEPAPLDPNLLQPPSNNRPITKTNTASIKKSRAKNNKKKSTAKKNTKKPSANKKQNTKNKKQNTKKPTKNNKNQNTSKSKRASQHELNINLG